MTRGLWLALLVLFAGGAEAADHAPPPPPDLAARVGVDQKLGASVPATLRFTEADGEARSLADVANGRPLLLALGYYRCPNLCDVFLHGLADVASRVKLRPGADYELAFLSIDPGERPIDAAEIGQRLANQHPGAAVARWHLLTGDAASIQRLAGAIGFRYFHDRMLDQYAHASGAVLLTPTAGSTAPRVAQYFLDIGFPPETLRLALVDASRGKLGSLVDHLVLFCSGYDPATGRYSLVVGRIMRVLGACFLLLLGAWLLYLNRPARARP
ncbi:MAG: SCO family protein [Xanthomonadales bacterium]|nr:SCO family protein [Xanthomonadales bacterium]